MRAVLVVVVLVGGWGTHRNGVDIKINNGQMGKCVARSANAMRRGANYAGHQFSRFGEDALRWRGVVV